ncbi:MAG: Flp pilus assembly complex ATPase component TadA [Nitrospinae bacterium]|nr:Flp pilus assembly complex ATPase component TadA [Nitrospinota bacterium]
MAVRERKRLGDLLIAAGVLAPEQLKQALEHQQQTKRKLGEALVYLKFITEEAIINTLADQLKIEVVNLDEVEPDMDLLRKIPEATARKYGLIPVSKEGNAVKIAIADPLNIFAIDEVAIKLGCEVIVAIARDQQVQAAITRHYGVTSSIREALRSIKGTTMKVDEGEEEAALVDITAAPTELAPVAKLLDTIVRQAVRERASDIHIEPDEEKLTIRTRVDGIMFVAATIPKALQAALISRAKVISHMDIAESRIPQDGRFKMDYEGKDVEFRVSTFPTIYGENVVLRILRKDATMARMEDTGLMDDSLKKALSILSTPFGIVVVTGPTGSGKTTTLYAALNLLNTVDKHIITVEDPVEYRLAGIRQAQVNVKAGLDFAKSMRAILRQDPDIIMVGEIRDRETAEIAIQAAMTGHLVLSSLHTNDAPSAVMRLVDIGIEPFMISSAMVGAIAQRLVRRICLHCKTPIAREEALKLVPKLPERITLNRGEGCMECKKSGYSGRIAIFEVLVMDEQAKFMVTNKVSAAELKDYATKKQGMTTMRQDGINKMLRGMTTYEEVKRVTSDY